MGRVDRPLLLTQSSWCMGISGGVLVLALTVSVGGAGSQAKDRIFHEWVVVSNVTTDRSEPFLRV